MTEETAASLAAEADAVANEAAREARAEVYERAEKQQQTVTASTKRKAAPKTPKKGWHHFVIDVWITNLNSYEFGIYKRSRNRAKSRQFTSDMDIYAEIIENGQRTGLLGYREDLWTKQQGMDKRLVFKLFSDKLNWRATMDLMIGRSLAQTIGSRGMPVMTYAINTDDDNFIVYLERSGNKWPFFPENFSFFLMDSNGQPEFYRLRRNVIDLGGDYTLYDQHDNVVGEIDGKVFSLGGKWKGKVKPGPAEKKLLTVLKLFGGMIIFNTDCRRHMKHLWRDVRSGKLKPKLERQESDLYMNPRRVR